MKAICSTAIAGVMMLLLLTVVPAYAASIVVPGPFATVEGDSANAYPFNLSFYGLTSQRYQQIYGASEFAALGGSVFITQIAFRPDAFPMGGAAFSTTLPNVRIDLSTTSKSPDGLSTTFADNVGANDVVVFNGALTLSSSFTGPAGGPKAFDIVINLTTPFLYDFTQGALLLDVRNFGGGRTTFFDAQNTTGDAISRMVSSGFSGVNDPTGTGDTLGLITRFTATPTATAVPEPATLTLIGLGLVGLMHRRRR